MATGYDNRETTRRSFAFAPKAGRQTRNDAAATPSIGAQGMAGSAATGGGNVIMSENPTLSGDAGANIPAFLEAALEPVVKAAQERRVREGYTAAANGTAMADIAKNQPGLASIFGPTDFQRGAQFFATQTAVSNWQQEQLENINELAKLPEEDLPRYLDEAAMNHMTGDVFADNAISAAILEANATLIPRIAQARVEWQQQELYKGAVTRNLAAFGAYQALTQSYLSQPEAVAGEDDPLGSQRINVELVTKAREDAMAAMLPVDGMRPEAFKRSVLDTARSLLADGNLWAYNALMEGGTDSVLFQTLDADELASLDTQYKTAGKAAQARALMQVGPEYDLYRTQVRLGQIPAAEVRERLNEFNVRIATLSGYTEPYFDADAMIRQTEGVVDDLVSGIEADENRAYNEYRDEYNRQANAGAEAAEEQQALHDILSSATVGDLQAATFQHGAAKVNTVITAAIREDPATAIPLLIRSHQNSRHVVSGARDILQAQVAANIAAGYDSESFQTAFNNWKAFNATPQGRSARAAYYGDYDGLFQKMNNLMANGTGITGTLAYAQTFGEAGALAGTSRPASAPTGERATAINSAIDSMGRPSWWQRGFGARSQLTDNARATIRRLAGGEAAFAMENDASLPAEEAVDLALSRLQGSKRIEIVGRDAWANPTQGDTLADLSQVPADRIGAVWNDLVDEGLERVGTPDRPYTVWRQGTGPATRWIVTTTSEDGESEVFQLDATMVRRRDEVREREDVQRRRNAQARNRAIRSRIVRND